MAKIALHICILHEPEYTNQKTGDCKCSKAIQQPQRQRQVCLFVVVCLLAQRIGGNSSITSWKTKPALEFDNENALKERNSLLYSQVLIVRESHLDCIVIDPKNKPIISTLRNKWNAICSGMYFWNMFRYYSENLGRATCQSVIVSQSLLVGPIHDHRYFRMNEASECDALCYTRPRAESICTTEFNCTVLCGGRRYSNEFLFEQDRILLIG